MTMIPIAVAVVRWRRNQAEDGLSLDQKQSLCRRSCEKGEIGYRIGGVWEADADAEEDALGEQDQELVGLVLLCERDPSHREDA